MPLLARTWWEKQSQKLFAHFSQPHKKTYLCDCRSERCFSVVNMTDGSDITVRLVSLEDLLLKTVPGDGEVPGKGKDMGGYRELGTRL